MLIFVCKLPDKKKFHILYVLCGLLAGGALGNKGSEAAEVAIKMVDYSRRIG